MAGDRRPVLSLRVSRRENTLVRLAAANEGKTVSSFLHDLVMPIVHQELNRLAAPDADADGDAV